MGLDSMGVKPEVVWLADDPGLNEIPGSVRQMVLNDGPSGTPKHNKPSLVEHFKSIILSEKE